MTKREIPNKNYVIFMIVAIASFMIVFNLANWYKNTKEEYIDKSIMSDTVSEVYENDIDNYIVENESFVLYISSRNDTTIKEFEKDLAELIIDEDISNKVIYLDTRDISSNFFDGFLTKHLNKEIITDLNSLDIIPNALYFKDHKITSVLYRINTTHDVDQVLQFLINNEVIEQ